LVLISCWHVRLSLGSLPCFLGAASHLLISVSYMCRRTVWRVSPVTFWLTIHKHHSWSEIICCGGEFVCFVSSWYWFANLSIALFRSPYFVHTVSIVALVLILYA
jgi:hypothetical protein